VPGDPFRPALVSVRVADEEGFGFPGIRGVHDLLLLRLAVVYSFDALLEV
jgi:hypothetical protein